ncbi:hypothetical protein YPPY46_0697, partial [Yersinia pestis PY-46]
MSWPLAVILALTCNIDKGRLI